MAAKNAIQIHLHIFINDIIDAIEAGFRGSQQGTDPIRSQSLFGAANASGGQFMAVTA